jgi:adenylosuccinate synthase
MKYYAVIGAGFGDEGKGLVTSSLALTLAKPIVVRYNGGHQAGHTVCTGEFRHVFSNFGSGTLFDVPTLWSRFCTFDPVAAAHECNMLRSNGFKPKLYVDLNCPVVTPYDMRWNQRFEGKNNHGTTGVGFGQTLQREQDHYHLKVRDLFYPEVFEEKLKLIHEYYGEPWGEIFVEPLEIIKNYNKAIADLNQCVEYIDTFYQYDDLFEHFDSIIFEGAQGLMLDQEIGFFPHVTRSNTGLKNIMTLMKEWYLETELLDVIYVTRSYLTRHGKGLLPGESGNYHLKLKNIENETNVQNEHQGKLRYAPLNLPLLKYAIESDLGSVVSDPPNYHYLAITCQDQLHIPKALISSYLKIGFDRIIEFHGPESCRINQIEV